MPQTCFKSDIPIAPQDAMGIYWATPLLVLGKQTVSKQNDPLIPASDNILEITFRTVCIAIALTVILSASNTYLALKIGMLTSASIPAAILSMGILRFWKNSTILENNLVQTAASAGEAIAGGIVYTIPALIIMHYWNHFDYLENCCIAFIGGVLGVLFSVPLRKVLMTEPRLSYPEAKAIAEVLQMNSKKTMGLKEMLWGGSLGALVEFAQTGIQIVASNVQVWFVAGKTFFGFGAGFSAAMIGAGYLMGFNIGLSILIGALMGWLVGMPLLSSWYGHIISQSNVQEAAMAFWNTEVRYVGVGAMLMAGLWTLILLAKPFYESLQTAVRITLMKRSSAAIPRTEHDIPLHYVLLGIGLSFVALYFLFDHFFDLKALGLPSTFRVPAILFSLFYVLIIGFIFSAICGYFSGLVGVTASPGSAIIMAALFLAALLLHMLLVSYHPAPLTRDQILHAAAMVVIVGSIIAGSIAIANDNIQDLKVGHLLGATPWKQQAMLLLGVSVAALTVPVVMELLFNVYGIVDVFPRAGMDTSQALAAPPAAMMAVVTQAVFNHTLPWHMLIIGAGLMGTFILINHSLDKRNKGLSALGVAIGIYLPLSFSIPLFVGGLLNFSTQRALEKKLATTEYSQLKPHLQRGVLFACGIVSGAALMNVLLAIPFALTRNPDILRIVPASFQPAAIFLGFMSVALISRWFYDVICRGKTP